MIVVDDASPDGTQEVAKQLAGIYGADRVVGRACDPADGRCSSQEPAN